jgi:hypothetical protein
MIRGNFGLSHAGMLPLRVSLVKLEIRLDCPAKMPPNKARSRFGVGAQNVQKGEHDEKRAGGT